MACERATLLLCFLLRLAADGGTAAGSPLSTRAFLQACSEATLTAPKEAIARPVTDGKKQGKRGRNPKAGHRFGLSDATHAILCVPQMVGREETFGGLMVKSFMVLVWYYT